MTPDPLDVPPPPKRQLPFGFLGVLVMLGGFGAFILRHFDHYQGAEGWLLLLLGIAGETGGMFLLFWGLVTRR